MLVTWHIGYTCHITNVYVKPLQSTMAFNWEWQGIELHNDKVLFQLIHEDPQNVRTRNKGKSTREPGTSLGQDGRARHGPVRLPTDIVKLKTASIRTVALNRRATTVVTLTPPGEESGATQPIRIWNGTGATSKFAVRFQITYSFDIITIYMSTWRFHYAGFFSIFYARMVAVRWLLYGFCFKQSLCVVIDNSDNYILW